MFFQFLYTVSEVLTGVFPSQIGSSISWLMFIVFFFFVLAFVFWIIRIIRGSA